MKKLRFETLTPAELNEAVTGRSLVYQPVGSMEWHGPHMGMGMDTANAYSSSLAAAEQTGGVVMPPLYIGTETPRSPETLRKVGFSGSEHIVGMDFPANSLKSFYWPPELFERIVRQQTQMLLDMGFLQVVWMNGHGADAQVEILQRVCAQASQTSGRCVMTVLTLFEGCGAGLGHAGLAETAIFMHLCPEAVELDRLPPKPEKLYNTRFAIVDNDTFQQGPNEDFSVRYDPRDATAELGRTIMEHTVAQCVRLVEDAAPRGGNGGTMKLGRSIQL